MKCITEKWVVSVRTESATLGWISRLDLVSKHMALDFIKLEKIVNISDTVFNMVLSSTWGGPRPNLQNENLQYRCFIPHIINTYLIFRWPCVMNHFTWPHFKYSTMLHWRSHSWWRWFLWRSCLTHTHQKVTTKMCITYSNISGSMLFEQRTEFYPFTLHLGFSYCFCPILPQRTPVR